MYVLTWKDTHKTEIHKAEVLNSSTADVLGHGNIYCAGLSWALYSAQQQPWPPLPTRFQYTLCLQLRTTDVPGIGSRLKQGQRNQIKEKLSLLALCSCGFYIPLL